MESNLVKQPFVVNPFVVPLIHTDLENGKQEFNGSGAVVLIDKKPTLVTCKHVFEDYTDKNVHNEFMFQSTLYSIDRNSDSYFESYMQRREHVGRFKVLIHDFAFYDLSQTPISTGLNLGNMQGQTLNSHYDFLAHDLTTGKQVKLSAYLIINGHASYAVSLGTEKALNMCSLNCEGHIPGYSGGVYLNQKGEFCGILQSGNPEKHSMSALTVESIEEAYSKLRPSHL